MALFGRLKIEPIPEINWPYSIQTKRKPLLLIDHEMNLANLNALLCPKKILQMADSKFLERKFFTLVSKMSRIMISGNRERGKREKVNRVINPVLRSFLHDFPDFDIIKLLNSLVIGL